MITIKCDNCEKPFQIEDDATGERVACPYCGDVNRVPTTSSAAVEKSTAPEALKAGRPLTAHAPAAADAEKHITVVRQAMFRAHPFWYILMVKLFVGGIVLAIASRTMAQLADKPWLLWVGLALSGVAFLWWLVWWAAPHRWVKLIITNRRTIRQEGIIMRKTSEVLHKHVTNVTIRQTFLQRIFGVGYIGIDSAGQSGEPMDTKDGQVTRQSHIEIEVENVPRPYDVKKIIDQYRG